MKLSLISLALFFTQVNIGQLMGKPIRKTHTSLYSSGSGKPVQTARSYFDCLHSKNLLCSKENNHEEIRVLHRKLALQETLEHLNKELGAAKDIELLRTTTMRKIYVNANIYAVDVDNDENWNSHPKEAMVVQGKQIQYVGTNAEAEKYYREGVDEWVDIKGYTIIPGIHDVHAHPLEASSSVGGTCHLSEDDDLETIGQKIKISGCANKQVGTDWVLGHGHSITQVLHYMNDSNNRSPKAILDEAIPNKPAIMMEQTSHSVWVNSKALQLAGINRDTPNEPGGIIWKDSNGEPNGILLENAGISIMELAMEPNAELDQYNYEGLKKGMKALSMNGITSVCDARSFWKWGHDKIWETLLQEEPDKFNVRAILSLWAFPEELDDQKQISELKKLYTDNNNSRLRKCQIKFYSDGLLQTTTAAVLEKYKINLHLQGLEANNGMNYFTQDRLAKYISQLQNFDINKGFDFHVHTIGDRGVRETLNAIEQNYDAQNPWRRPRHRLTHVELVSKNDIPRFRKLDVIADFQVAGNFTLPDSKSEIAELVGWEKADQNIPVKSLVESGATVTLSSDWDVSELNPFIGIQHAIMRRDRWSDQSISVKTALELYTINPAYLMRQEDKVGSLVAGKEADFVVINVDILDPQMKHYIANTKVFETVFQGRTVYKNYS
ncbi:hypothetical protein ACJMK2_007202 [Sinanodonta woodiana]|uniref:Amidohydrolase 3 domain-containing protein n=1 Tax=Sinanodonta woodiana TaxID=1069815 RepID=A0ABD3VKR7_SINWO